MKSIRIFCISLLTILAANLCQAQTKGPEVTLQTSMGKIIVALYNETPIHRDNFLAQVRRGYYDGILFHRVIASFMIQAGDSASRNVPIKNFENSQDSVDEYRLPAEIRFPQIFHRRGVIAAARQGDDVNPKRGSSPYEFYIAWGKYFNPRDMDAMQEKIMEREDSTRWFTFPQAIRDAYEIDGGIPHLDNEYTVFGEVVKGLDVVGQIQAVKTDSLDRPLKDVRIKKAWISKE